MNYKLTKTSKRMSYVLRHHPEQIGIHLDKYGRVNLKVMIHQFNRYYRGTPLNKKIIHQIMKLSSKKRFGIEGGNIRALYGHSVPVKPLTSPKEPPRILYHGTTHHAAKLIRVEGIKKMDRDFVHLSTTTGMAHQVGARRDPHPVIFNVSAKRASNDGLAFYPTASGIWLVDYVPPKYLQIR